MASTALHFYWLLKRIILNFRLILALKEQWNNLNFCLYSFARAYLSKLSCNIARPLCGLLLILSLVVLAPKTLCFYTSPCLYLASMCWPDPPRPPSPSAPHPLKPLFFPPTRQTTLGGERPGGLLAAVRDSIKIISFKNNQIG